MRVVAIERAPIPRWYDHAILWCAIIAVQVVAARPRSCRRWSIGDGRASARSRGSAGRLVVVVDVRYLHYRRAIDYGHRVRRHPRSPLRCSPARLAWRDGDDTGYFGPESASWHVQREVTVLFGGARALLQQAAHPLVVAGANQTGMYDRNPWKRLQRTLILTYTVTFGTKAEADAAAERINEVHTRINGDGPGHRASRTTRSTRTCSSTCTPAWSTARCCSRS